MGMFRFRRARKIFKGSGVASLTADTITSAKKPVMMHVPTNMVAMAA